MKYMNSETDVLVLKILSKKYTKPLPPLDWCFLQELIHMRKFRKFCINLASHQVILSGSARRLIENMIIVATENTTDVCKNCKNNMPII